MERNAADAGRYDLAASRWCEMRTRPLDFDTALSYFRGLPEEFTESDGFPAKRSSRALAPLPAARGSSPPGDLR